jgi:hypothetical protein
MSEQRERPEGFFFSHREIATDLIKKQGIHEGRWKLTLELGLGGNSLPLKKPDGTQELHPAGLVLVTAIGITRTEEVNNLTVDAAEVNPAPATRKRSKAGKRATKRDVKK